MLLLKSLFLLLRSKSVTLKVVLRIMKTTRCDAYDVCLVATDLWICDRCFLLIVMRTTKLEMKELLLLMLRSPPVLIVMRSKPLLLKGTTRCDVYDVCLVATDLWICDRCFLLMRMRYDGCNAYVFE